MYGFEFHAELGDVESVRAPDDWALSNEWDAQAVRLDHPFLMSDWLEEWWNAFAPPGATREILERRDLRGLAQAAPLYRAARGRLHGLANVHTPVSGMLVPGETGVDGLVLPADVSHLVWPSLNHAEAVSLAGQISDEGWLAVVEPQHISPVVEMESSFEAYSSSRGRSMRQRAGRLRRKVEREHDATLTFGRPGDDHRLFEVCLQLEALGWKGRNRTAILSDHRTASFYRAVAAMPHARLAALVTPVGPIAFALCVEHADRLYLLKTGYDEQLSSLSPGFVLTNALIELSHERGLIGYELLGSGEPWKLQFANAARPISRLVAHRRSPGGHLRHRARLARPLAKALRAKLT